MHIDPEEWKKWPKAPIEMRCCHCRTLGKGFMIVHLCTNPGVREHLVICTSCIDTLNYPAWEACTCTELEGVER